MTFRDPYTGVEIPARRPPPRSPLQRWWPAAAIAVAAIVVGYFEWHSAQTPLRPPATAATSSQPAAPHSSSPAAPGISTAAASDEIARATAALATASDQLSGTSNLLIGIAVLQAIVLVGQLYLFGQQRRAARKPQHN